MHALDWEEIVDWLADFGWTILLVVAAIVKWIAARVAKMRELKREEPSWMPSEESIVQRFRRAHQAVKDETRRTWPQGFAELDETAEAVKEDRERLKELVRQWLGPEEEFTIRSDAAFDRREGMGVYLFLPILIGLFIGLAFIVYVVLSRVNTTSGQDTVLFIALSGVAVVLAFAVAFRIGAWRGINDCEYGWRLLKRGRYAGAARYLRRAVERRPRSFSARYGLAYALASTGQRDEALLLASELARDFSSSPLPHELVAGIEYALADIAAAAQGFRRAGDLARGVGADAYAEMMDRWADFAAHGEAEGPLLWVGEWGPPGFVRSP